MIKGIIKILKWLLKLVQVCNLHR
ncbi:MAG: hypothetical protein RL368_954, partial [Pseudomonadota bacterium]